MDSRETTPQKKTVQSKVDRLKFIAKELGETDGNEIKSGFVSSHRPRPTDKYMSAVSFHRPVAVFFTMALYIFSPLVFRYAMLASVIPGYPPPKNYVLGNGTIDISTTWECESCNYSKGVTMKNVHVDAYNVTSPDGLEGYPSLAVFISQDMVTWRNYFLPDQDRSYAFFDSGYQQIDINNTIGTGSCLGTVANTYVVACLNVRDLAFQFEKMDEVPGPPFDDRCFQIASTCGVSCLTSTYGQEPPFCVDGMIPDKYIIDGNTTTAQAGEEVPWGKGLDFFDWCVLLVIFVDTFGNIMRFLPVLSGEPSEVEGNKGVHCTGSAVYGCGTPIVAENEAIFLRGLIGRTATMLHTVGGRHNMKGLYCDVILNEKRVDEEDPRVLQWTAWLEFIQFLCSLKTKTMTWEHTAEEMNTNVQHKMESKTTTAKGFTCVRQMRVKRDATVSFDCGLADVKFEGVQLKVDNSYEYDLELEEDDYSSDDESVPLRSRGIGAAYKNFDADGKLMKDQEDLVTQSADGIDHMPQHFKSMKKQEVVARLLKEKATMTADIIELMPLICFLDGWLEEIKHKDSTYDYKNKTNALKSMFSDAPADKFFDDNTLLDVKDHLEQLFAIFNGDKKAQMPTWEDGFIGYEFLLPNQYLHRDQRVELTWVIKRPGLPDFDISWNYWSRARLRAKHADDKTDDGALLECTRVKEGAIVYIKPPSDISPAFALEKWVDARARTFKVKSIRSKTDVVLEPWPLLKFRADLESNDIVDLAVQGNDFTVFDPNDFKRLTCHAEFDNLALLEKNRGKAGSLNTYLEFLRLHATRWAAERGVQTPVKTLGGIIDARHMLAEPHIFWNEALPLLSQRTEHEPLTQPVILVQYPQFFSNVGRNDFLDNKNSGYYTIWQTLRDCSKVCTSSGTNAIWDITDPQFEYATTSRIEDTGTTQQVFDKSLCVHLPTFVAYGIAKDTEDYIEAVYRWSTGAVELFWATLFSHQYKHFIIVGIMFLVFTFACFSSVQNAYWTWPCLMLVGAAYGGMEQGMNTKPLRGLNVSCTIVMNSLYWLSNLTAITWSLILPTRIAFYGKAPLSNSGYQALIWAFISLILRLPVGIITDQIIALSQFLSPKTVEDGWNYNMVLWRSSQLYMCSFAYTLLSIFVGTSTAYSAAFYDTDNTMWSSFRISESQLRKAKDDIAMYKKKGCFNFNYQLSVYFYYRLKFQIFANACQDPAVLTKFFVAFVLFYQVACIMASVAYTNKEDAGYIVVTMIICTFNFALTIDIAMLLMPSLERYVGRPVRPEYVFGSIAMALILSAVLTGQIEVYFLGFIKEVMAGWLKN